MVYNLFTKYLIYNDRRIKFMNKFNNGVIISALIIFLLTSCEKEHITIAVIKFTNHPALNEFEDGFLSYMDSMKKNSGIYNNINIEVYNANGNPQKAKELAEISTRKDTKLIVAIATPAAQAVTRTQSNIPLFYGAVADPIGAGIIPSNRATGIQNSGPTIIRKALCFITEFFPKATRLGTLYNPGEQNSVYVQKLIKYYADSLKLKLIQRTILDPTQLSSITEDLTSQVDVIYSANDNTVNAGVATVVSICNSTKTPFIIGDLSTLQNGPMISIGLEYRELGASLARLVNRYLQGEPIKSLPPLGPPEPKIWINIERVKAYGLKIPDKLSIKIDSTFSKF